jgi:hypothetical protein
VGLRARDTGAFVPVRLTLGRFLALGLEFQPASDVLRTAVAPNFRELGQLAAVAAIRTALKLLPGQGAGAGQRRRDPRAPPADRRRSAHRRAHLGLGPAGPPEPPPGPAPAGAPGLASLSRFHPAWFHHARPGRARGR